MQDKLLRFCGFRRFKKTMFTGVSILILLVSLVFPLLSTEYCSSIKQFDVTWPRIPLKSNVVKDCSEINSSWAGEFTAYCMEKKGNFSWHFKGGCNCEDQTVLRYFNGKVSGVDHSSFLDTATELVNSERNFTNKKTFKGFLNVLKTSMCDKPPQIKSELWDRIHLYCETELRSVVDRNRSSHFDEYLCQKVEKLSYVNVGLTSESLTGSKHNTGTGVAVVILDKNSTQLANSTNVINILEEVNSSDCHLIGYDVNDFQLTIKATEDKADSTISEKPKKIRDAIELALMCASLVAIVCSLIILSCVRVQSSEKIFVHKNFLLAWAFGYLVYILDVTAFTSRERHPEVCTAVVVVRHFFHTAVFTWMLVEAINLYIKLVKVIPTKASYLTYVAIGWGVPAVIVGITAAATRAKAYDMKQTMHKDFMCGSIKFTARLLRNSCWLEGSKWLYAGPVLGILVVNVIFFAILLKVVLGNVASKYDNSKIIRTRKGMKCVVTLLPLLGVTWLLGFFIEFHEVLAYIFVLLTSTQGIVFCVFHCILDEQVRKSLTQRFRRPPTSTGNTPGGA